MGGKLYSLVYGHVIAQNNDPIEKKPLYHFYPGSMAYSVGTMGCNLLCPWCQNWEISHFRGNEQQAQGAEVPPAQIIENARSHKCRTVAYTYTEPTVFFEYAYDTALLARKAGLANVLVTNGFMTEEMLSAFLPVLDAANVDIKTFRDKTYRTCTTGHLAPVLNTLKWMKDHGVWLEVTTLVIPGVNDEPSELGDIASFVAHELGCDTPWHISRFYPAYQMSGKQPTRLETLRLAYELGAKEGLRYLYVGNVPEEGKQDTRCPNCEHVLIKRDGLSCISNYLERSVCPYCGMIIAGVGMNGNGSEGIGFPTKTSIEGTSDEIPF
jgi:pyruvate formate lyase activating enzyme